MNDAPSMSRTEVAEQLWRWLPAVYRARDEQQAAAADTSGRPPGPGPLRSFIGLLADELWRLRQLAEQQYDDHFIDSAQDWVIPYLADLVGSSVLFTGDASQLREVAARNREDVKNTMRRRRRKGTLQALEGATADAGGFGVLAVEMLTRTAVTHHLQHGMAGGAFTADLRRHGDAAAIGTPFGATRALADLRTPDLRQGWHAVHKVLAFAWPDAGVAQDEATPREVTGGGAGLPRRYTFHPLGRDTALLAGGATEALRAAVAARPGAAGADILHDQANDLPIRCADLRLHVAAYVDSPLGFALHEDGIALVGGGAPATASLRPAVGHSVLQSRRGLVVADRGVYGAGTLAELAVVRLGAVLNNALVPPAPVPYSPGAAFASQLRLRAAAGRCAVDTVGPDFGYTQGSAPYEPAAGAYHRAELLLRVSNRGALALDWPECEAIVRNARGTALQLALPAIAALPPGAEQFFYVSDDGSTYFARADHGPGDPDRNPDGLLFGAYLPGHLARASLGQRRLRPGRPPGADRWRRVVARPLCCWDQALSPPLQAGEVAVDPERGRIAFPAGEAPSGDFSVDFRLGQRAALGAGPFARATLPAAHRLQTVAKRRNADHQTLQGALDALLDNAAVVQVVEVQDSAVYDEALRIDGRVFPAAVIVRAAAGCTPVLRRNLPFTVQASSVAALTLEGLCLAGGPLVASGALAALALRHCTLDPVASGLQLQAAAACTVTLERCISGPLALGPAGSTLVLADSVVQHPQASPESAVGLQAVAAVGAVLQATRCTLLGGVTAERASLSNTLLLGALALAEPEAGCLRYSRLPVDFVGPAFACTTVQPLFVTLQVGANGWAALHPNAAAVLLRGGEEGGEIGAMAPAGLPWRAAGALQRLQEYTPAGLLPALAWVTPRPPRSR